MILKINPQIQTATSATSHLTLQPTTRSFAGMWKNSEILWSRNCTNVEIWKNYLTDGGKQFTSAFYRLKHKLGAAICWIVD